MNAAKRAVVIGAGLGGISAAISLAASGFQVQVFEKNQHVGGKLNVTTKDGFVFDLGPSIVTMPYLFERLFTMSGRAMADYLEFVPVHPHWRCFFPDETVRDLTKQLPTASTASGYTSETLAELQSFLAYSKRLFDFTDSGYFARGADTLMQLMRQTPFLDVIRDSDFAHTLNHGIERHVSDPYLQEMLRFFIKYVGSSPYDAPAVLNLLPHVQFDMDLWYVRGGMYSLAQGLQKLMEDQGIEIELGSEVTGIREEQSRAAGITLADGRTVDADVVVSNMEFIPAYRSLLGVDEAALAPLEKKFEPACSGLALHLGVDCVYDHLAHHNVFFSADSRDFYATIFHKKELPPDPSIYLVAPCATDSDLAPPGCSVIKILPHIPHLTDLQPTTEDYSRLREWVLDKLETMGLVDLRKHIIVEDMWTPLDIQQAYYSNRGAIYGVVSDRRKNLGFKGPKRSQRLQPLYFVGGSVNPGGGMPMVVLSGQQVGDMVLADLG